MMEQRLIDANALRAKCDAPHWCVWMSEIDDAPTVDAVEVVRCKDCKHSELEFFLDNGTTRIERYKCLHPIIGINILEHDDFCSYGERRDSDD